MAQQKTKKEHYVPRFYLKGFSNKKGKTHYLYAYDKSSGKTFPTNINDIVEEHYFYDVTTEQVVEKLFSKFEARFNKALQKQVACETLP